MISAIIIALVSQPLLLLMLLIQYT